MENTRSNPTERSNSTNVHEHVRIIQKQMSELRDHLREDIAKIDDPQGKALFEVSAEVVGGLHKAFEDFEKRNEEAWQTGGEAKDKISGKISNPG